MHNIFICVGFRLVVVLALALLSLGASAQTADAGSGKVTSVNGRQLLQYTAVVRLNAKSTPGTVKFFCNPRSDKNSRGALGFTIEVQGVTKLAPFNFDDFEGPEAATNGKKLVRASIVRAGKPPQVFNLMQTGSYVTHGVFSFDVADESRRASSPPRTLLEALTVPAESLQFVITDPRNAKVQLELRVPLAGMEAQFKALLVGLK